LSDKASLKLSKYFEIFKKEKKEEGKVPPTIDELIGIIEKEHINENTKAALLSSLYSLKSFSFISNKDNFKYKSLGPKPGRLLIFDLSSIDNLEHKQLLVHYYLSRFFNGTKKGKFCPTLAIIEEAHNFCPEKEKMSRALSRDIINTIAREGRKFFFSLCLISQRPVNLSTTALSQCNSNVILRITNPNDLEHIEQSAESIDAHSLSFISSLEVGSALVIGEASKFPIFLSVRKRKTDYIKSEKTFQQAAKEFEEKEKELEEELQAYMDNP
ncbi:MAG: ATP-binding protein, partial [Candidatus Anstonellaceae archaeon]